MSLLIFGLLGLKHQLTKLKPSQKKELSKSVLGKAHYLCNGIILARFERIALHVSGTTCARLFNTFFLHSLGLIMVLAGASEFDPQYNKDATSKPADNVLIPQVIIHMGICVVLTNTIMHICFRSKCFLQLIREIGGINLKKNEPPLTCPYSLKARVLLLAHLSRMQIPDTLKEGNLFFFAYFINHWLRSCMLISLFCFTDQQFLLKKCPALLQEMVNVICQLIIMARSREGKDTMFAIDFPLNQHSVTYVNKRGRN